MVVARASTLSLLNRLDPKRKASVVLFLYEAELIGLSGGTVFSFKRNDEETLPVVRLFYANLQDMYMAPRTYLRGVDMAAADLSSANLSDTLLYDANLVDANLNKADLDGADLRYADLRDTDLHNASLKDAQLEGASLSGARGITNEQLEQQTHSLEGTIMLNGQKYEDWLKDKEGHKEDGENSGPS